jgi:glutamate:GABA antiporter
MMALSFAGASVKEAFVTLLDLAVVLQLVPFLYVYALIIRMSSADAPETRAYSKTTLRLAGISGLLTTALGMIVAFVPSRQIESVLVFEAKLVAGCALFLGLAVFFFKRGERIKGTA